MSYAMLNKAPSFIALLGPVQRRRTKYLALVLKFRNPFSLSRTFRMNRVCSKIQLVRKNLQAIKLQERVAP
jgi:hypothetical protein